MGLDLAGLDEGGEGGEAVFVVNNEGHGILVEELEDGWGRICRGGVDDNFGGHGGDLFVGRAGVQFLRTRVAKIATNFYWGGSQTFLFCIVAQ